MKTREELLSSFKKANKQRREVLANRAGFDTVDDYFEHLVKGVEKEKKAKKKITIHNIHVLDISGSMGWFTDHNSKCRKAYEGIQHELRELQKDKKNNYLNTLVCFDSDVNTIYSDVSCAVALRSREPDGGSATALNDAIVHTLKPIIESYNDSDRYLVKIFTDGGENNSTATYTQAKNWIARAEELGVTTTFVGTQYDTDIAISRYNLHTSNTLVHDNTTRAVMDSFTTTAQATTIYATKVAAGATKEETLDGFYKTNETL